MCDAFPSKHVRWNPDQRQPDQRSATYGGTGTFKGRTSFIRALRWVEINSPTLIELRSFDEEAVKKQISEAFNYFSSCQPIANGEVWEKHIEREFVAVAQRWEAAARGWGEERNLILHAKAQAWQKLRMLRTPLEQIPCRDIRVICELRGQKEPPPRPSSFATEQRLQYLESPAGSFSSRPSPEAQQRSGMSGINTGSAADVCASISDRGMIDAFSIIANARERARKEDEAATLLSRGTTPAIPYDPVYAASANVRPSMMDRLTQRPPVNDPACQIEPEGQARFRPRWQVPKIIDLADYRERGDKASLDHGFSTTSDAVVLVESQSSNSEELKVTERTNSNALSGDVLSFPTGIPVPASQINHEGHVPDRDCESEGELDGPTAGPAGRYLPQTQPPASGLISPTDTDIFFRAARKIVPVPEFVRF
jgi:hypothetical protein